MNNLNYLIEQLAALSHEQWSGWTKWMFEKWDEIHSSGETFQERWKRQMSMPYSELSETEKESDRIEARKELALIQPLLDEMVELRGIIEVGRAENLETRVRLEEQTKRIRELEQQLVEYQARLQQAEAEAAAMMVVIEAAKNAVAWTDEVYAVWPDALSDLGDAVEKLDQYFGGGPIRTHGFIPEETMVRVAQTKVNRDDLPNL